MEKIVCKLCNKVINTKKENYVRVTDYFKGKEKQTEFYHTVCFLDRVNKAINPKIKRMEQVAMGLLSRTSRMLDNIEGKKEDKKVYIG